MNLANKVSSKYISALGFAIVFFALNVQSKDKRGHTNHFYHYLTSLSDTPPPNKKGFPQRLNLSGIKKNDLQPDVVKITKDTTIKKDTVDLKLSKDSLDAIIEYSADDSMVFDVPAKIVTLYGKTANTKYKDNDLSAPVIQLNQATGNIFASLKKDSAGHVIAMAVFKQGDASSQSDSVKFNMKTGKGITKSTYTKQGEMYVNAEVIKKVSNNVFFAKRARFTTCDLDTPHFAFVSNRVKFYNQKVAITGPVHPEFEGVPIPIYFPFGIYPLNQGRHSGFLAPNFTTNQQLGLGLEGLGYYKVLSDYWDVVVRGNIYSYGGWTMNINPRYTKKYRYNGNISLDIQEFKQNFKGDPDYTKNRSYHLSWSHSVDSKARPGVSFSANVNAASSSYNQYVPDNPIRNFSNQLQSSVVYSKTWKDKPFNLTVSANHNQNTLQKLVNINFPDVAFNVNTLYPFREKEAAGTPKWYENLGISYSGNIKSIFSFYDTVPDIFKHIKDTLQWGAHHSLPITLSLPQVGAFQFSPSISYEETWYQRKFIRSWDIAKQKVDTTITKGFFTARQMSFGMGVSTRIFGTFGPKNPDSKIIAIRHEIRPTISFNYQPDLNKQNYYLSQIDTFNNKSMFSVFEGNVFGAYGSGKFGGINFGIDNNLQMKVRNKKSAGSGDSTSASGDNAESGVKKITLIDGLSINGGYNLVADSFNFSNFNINAHTSLFNNKANVTAGAIIDPYEVNARGQRINTLVWKKTPLSLGRLVSGNISVSSQFQGGSKDKKSSEQVDEQRKNDFTQRNGYTPDEYQNELSYIRNNPGEYADFNIPWSVNLSYSLTFNKVFKADYSGFENSFSQNVTFGGTLNLTPKWQMGVNGYYNLTEHTLGTISISISREMHCWQMAINLSPVGRYRFFSISISPKSALLRDLRINRTRASYDN